MNTRSNHWPRFLWLVALFLFVLTGGVTSQESTETPEGETFPFMVIVRVPENSFYSDERALQPAPDGANYSLYIASNTTGRLLNEAREGVGAYDGEMIQYTEAPSRLLMSDGNTIGLFWVDYAYLAINPQGYWWDGDEPVFEHPTEQAGDIAEWSFFGEMFAIMRTEDENGDVFQVLRRASAQVGEFRVEVDHNGGYTVRVEGGIPAYCVDLFRRMANYEDVVFREWFAGTIAENPLPRYFRYEWPDNAGRG